MNGIPGEVVGRGFLRNYATYLGLEGGEMIDRRRTVADDLLAAALVNASAGAPMPPERKVDYRPKDVMLKEEGEDLNQPRPLSLAPFFTLGALALVAVLAWLAVTQVAPKYSAIGTPPFKIRSPPSCRNRRRQPPLPRLPPLLGIWRPCSPTKPRCRRHGRCAS